jgi:NADH dehydrogenase [ubiquinone] 1 alpha subcomplex assembly factor 1
MIAQYVGFTVTLTNRIRLLERRTRAYGQLKPEPIRFGRCRINRQVRTHAIHELFGLRLAYRQTYVIRSLLLVGLLLMTFTSPLLNASGSHSRGELVLTDFTSTSPDLGWYVVNDNVMGGRSDGDFEQVQGELHFTGRTNTNGGGFSSIRTKPLQLDLSKYAGIQLHVRGDGRRYTWRLATAARWRDKQVSYWADFEALDGAWSVVKIPFASFIPRYRGYELDGPALDPGQITGMGLMIYDKQDGAFDLRMANVLAYPAVAH